MTRKAVSNAHLAGETPGPIASYARGLAGERGKAMSEIKHTPMPWRVKHLTNVIGRREDCDVEVSIATTSGSQSNMVDTSTENRANAELIVLAVNNHARLVAALRAMVTTALETAQSCIYCGASFLMRGSECDSDCELRAAVVVLAEMDKQG